MSTLTKNDFFEIARLSLEELQETAEIYAEMKTDFYTVAQIRRAREYLAWIEVNIAEFGWQNAIRPRRRR